MSEFSTPHRDPWYFMIKECQDAVDRHTQMYLETYDVFHLNQADLIRLYMCRLKEWITKNESEMNDACGDS
jgi:hypothetical protein